MGRKALPVRRAGLWAWSGVVAGVFGLGLVLGWLLPHHGPVDLRVASEAPATATLSASGPTLTVATYNIHSFFDNFDNPYTDDEQTAPKSRSELTALAAAFQEMNADVVILQEVEAGGFLKQFVRERLGTLGYEYVVDESTDDPRGITLGVLSKLPVRRIVSHRLTSLGAGRRFARDLLRVDIAPREGVTLAVYGMHLKSRLDAAGDPKSARWRLAEVLQIRQIVEDETRREGLAWYVLAGDCNDELASAVVQGLMATGGGLTDALAAWKPEDRITFENAKYREGIDHLLLSPLLGGRMVADSGVILRGGPFDKASDHRPVRVTLRVP